MLWFDTTVAGYRSQLSLICLFLVPFPCHLNYVEDYTFDFIFKRLGVFLQKLRLRKRLSMLFLHAGETVMFYIIFLFIFFLMLMYIIIQFNYSTATNAWHKNALRYMYLIFIAFQLCLCCFHYIFLSTLQ